MAKKIILLADGTGNAYSTQESNIWRLFRAIDNSQDQITYYVRGVGTSTLKPWALFDGATGIGVPANVRDLYMFLCSHWEAGSKIYMFGFSRGAFTIRSLIKLIAREGLIDLNQKDHLDQDIRLGREELTAYATDAYRSFWHKVAQEAHFLERPLSVHFAEVARRVRRSVCVPKYDSIKKIEAPDIEFVGLFDSVEAFGVPIEEMRYAINRVILPISFRNGRISSVVKTVRHALSLDDERTSFHPLRIEPESDAVLAENPDQIKEVWFAGAHSDVGGGYPDGALSYAPLLWMIDELRRTSSELKFRAGVEAEWRKISSSFESTHDSREGFYVLYRYEPRDPQPLRSDRRTRFDPPLVHHSVVERMAFGHDSYAPTILPANAKVLLPNGVVTNLLSDQGSIPPEVAKFANTEEPALANALNALRELAKPDDRELELARDGIWKRRLNYYALVLAIGAFFVMPLYADMLSDWLSQRIASTSVFRYWLSFLDAVGGMIGRIDYSLPDFLSYFVGSYCRILSEHPAIFVASLAAIYLLYRKSVGLAQNIADHTRNAWLNGKALLSAKAVLPEKKARSLIEWMRTNSGLRFAHQIGAGYIMPTIWIAALLFSTVALVSHAAFNFRSAWNNSCQATSDPQFVETSLAAKQLFETKQPCWASGLAVTQGESYRLRLVKKDSWRDRPVVDNAWSLLARPFQRAVLDRRFQPIIRIGASRVQEIAPPILNGTAMEGAGVIEMDFYAKRSGEVFLYVNDLIPIGGFFRDFYGRNEGTAELTIEHVAPPKPLLITAK